MKLFKMTLFISIALINISAYAGDVNTQCNDIKGKRAKIENIYYGTPTPLGFSVMLNTVTDDGKKSDNSGKISFSRKSKSKGGAAAIELLTSAINNNYIFVVDDCYKGSILSFHVETNSLIAKG
jgi:hypothetical protein